MFVYGTLKDPDLRCLVCGAPDPAPPQPATALGWRAVHVPGQAYPVLRRAPHVRAPGLWLATPNEVSLRRLFAYEGTDYRLTLIATQNVAGKTERVAAFLGVRQTSGRRPWSFAMWQRREKRTALRMAGAYFASYTTRARLAGLRVQSEASSTTRQGLWRRVRRWQDWCAWFDDSPTIRACQR